MRLDVKVFKYLERDTKYPKETERYEDKIKDRQQKNQTIYLVEIS